MIEISDDELLKFVIEADDELLKEGKSPKQRTMHVVSKVMRRLNFTGPIIFSGGGSPFVSRIIDLHSSLYRPADLAIGGLHGGVFMFRDIFSRIYIPIGFGTVRIEPLTLTDLSPMQINWLRSRPKDFDIFLDQFIDIFDFAGGLATMGNYKRPPKVALDIFRLSAFQLQAAAATLCVAFDFEGAVQSAIIGAELALKAGLAASGADEAARRRHSHDLTSAATALGEAYPNFDLARILSTVQRLPAYVDNRYSPIQPSRLETGHIVMGAQYIAGEVMRQVAAFSIRSSLTPPTERIYPCC